MKKIYILFVLVALITMTSCSSNKKTSMEYDYINSEIEYCKPDDNGRYEVSLILETGEKFVYHSTHDVYKIDKEIDVNMGYDFDEKVTKLAVIKPQQ